MNKRRWLAVALFCVAVAAVRWVAAENDSAKPSDNVKSLRFSWAELVAAENESAKPSDQIAELTKRVQALEARIDMLERKGAIEVTPLTQAHSSLPSAPQYMPGAVPPQAQVPPNWAPFQFNGMTYYIVPLGTSSNGP